MMLIGSSPNNTVESIFTIIVILVMVWVFAFSINQVGAIMDKISQETQLFQQQLSVISKYMIGKHTSSVLQQKVRSYLEYNFQNLDNINIKSAAQEIIDKLPNDLQESLIKEINQNLIKKFELLRNNFSKKTLDTLLLHMKEQLYIKGENIYTQDQNYDISLYMITQGTVEIYIQRDHESPEQEEKLDKKYQQKEEVLIKICKKGDIIGTTGNCYQFTARCKETCTVYKISKENLEGSVRKNPHDFEKYKMVKDKLMFPRNIQRTVNQKCMICDTHYHNE